MSHVEVGLALLAVGLVLGMYMAAYQYFAATLDSAYLSALWAPAGTGVADNLLAATEEVQRTALREVWRECANHGDSLWNDMMWWCIALVVLAVLVLVGSLGTKLYGMMRGTQ